MITIEEIKIGNSLKWSSLAEIMAKFVTPVTNMLLARILAPEEFGVLASVNMIISFATIFADAGFAKYIIQHDFSTKNEKEKYLNVAFWVNFLLALLIWLIMVIFRNYIAILVGNPGKGNVLAIAGVQLVITSFSSMQTSICRREFRFKTLFIVRIGGAIVPLIITVPLAIFLKSYWALVIGNIVVSLFNTIILTIMVEWKPHFYFNFFILKQMLSYSMWSVAEAFAYWCVSWVDIFIIGNAFSEYYLGLYKNSLNMINSITALVSASMIPVLFSTLSRVKDEKIVFADVYYSFQRIASYILIPAGIGIFFYRDFVTQILLGSQWKEADKIIGCLAMVSCVAVIFSYLSAEVYKAIGIPKILVFYQISILLTIIPSCMFLKNYGFWEMVYGRAAVSFLQIPISFCFLKKFAGFRIIDQLKNLANPIKASVIVLLCCVLFRRISDNIIWNFASVILCIISYIIVLTVWFQKDIKKLFKIFRMK